MKKYYVNGKETTEQEAKVIEARNAGYMSSTDFSLWAKCEFITVITLSYSYSTSASSS